MLKREIYNVVSLITQYEWCVVNTLDLDFIAVGGQNSQVDGCDWLFALVEVCYCSNRRKVRLTDSNKLQQTVSFIVSKSVDYLPH